jgi:DNA-directed RNA polymerase specialized sigma24 family protein
VDPQARFEAGYATDNDAVRTYVGRRVDSQDADDGVADVFVIAWRRRVAHGRSRRDRGIARFYMLRSHGMEVAEPTAA